jgi:hypothetical protein
MKKLTTIMAIIVGAGLLSVAPFSLCFAPERIVSLSMDTAVAQPRGPGRIPKSNVGCRWVRGVRVC